MSYRIRFSKNGQRQYEFWKKADRRIFDDLNRILAQMKETPFEGEGSPEALKHELSGKWSRRLTMRDRIVYEMVEGEIIVLQCRFHY